MSKAIRRLETILKKINFIENICNNAGSIYKALEDEEMKRASSSNASYVYSRAI